MRRTAGFRRQSSQNGSFRWPGAPVIQVNIARLSRPDGIPPSSVGEYTRSPERKLVFNRMAIFVRATSQASVAKLILQLFTKGRSLRRP